MVKFPSREQRPEQYSACGSILAETATAIGISLSDSTPEAWSDFMRKLATADDVFEARPEEFRVSDELLSHFGLPNTTDALNVANSLVRASREAQNTNDIKEHFLLRGQEAADTVDLLRLIEPVALPNETPLWRQLTLVAITGNFVDSLRDAREDSLRMPQFSETELAINAIINVIKFAPKIKPKTWSALIKSAHHYGLDTYVLGDTRRKQLQVTES